MHHPGPPVFTAVGHDVDLSPRDPDPSATYHWTVKNAPEGSDRRDRPSPPEFLSLGPRGSDGGRTGYGQPAPPAW